ncbi:preprotein translocase subunit SecD [Halobacteriales archaeon QH_10_67_22]|nr:MAG: preprotein translocase subunit SecD [Halobacteriales archaeon QH_10_67_22]
MNVRENWRIVLLVVFVVGSSLALFAPFAQPDAGNASAVDTSGPTNLQFGLELAGGTRIRAPLVGTTAENLEFGPDQESSIRSTVSERLNVSQSSVNVRGNTDNGGAVEVLEEDVDEGELVAALEAAGVSASAENVRDGTTRETREQTVETMDAKINRAGLSGGQARSTTSVTGDSFVIVEIPNANRSEVRDLIGDRGVVEIVAHYPENTDNGTRYVNETVLTNEQLERSNVGTAQVRQGVPGVDVTLTDDAANDYRNTLREAGFTSGDAASNCRFGESEQAGYCLLTTLDGEVVYSAGVTPGLAELIESGEFLDNPTFIAQTNSIEEAQALQINLRAGALPARLDFEDGTVSFLQPSLANRFKFNALLTGLAAWLMVSGVVFLRYKDPRVAVPMLVTAMAEVYLLLGFASAIGLPLDLSHIAGFIAVIGTGVDDLLIIADEILQQGNVATGRVFQNRFRKAFWVIGAAAVTTIIAMSPLAVLSLGDLTGFAIVTIVGVLIGVLVTRPAYGDVLRNLMLDQGGD